MSSTQSYGGFLGLSIAPRKFFKNNWHGLCYIPLPLSLMLQHHSLTSLVVPTLYANVVSSDCNSCYNISSKYYKRRRRLMLQHRLFQRYTLASSDVTTSVVITSVVITLVSFATVVITSFVPTFDVITLVAVDTVVTTLVVLLHVVFSYDPLPGVKFLSHTYTIGTFSRGCQFLKR